MLEKTPLYAVLKDRFGDRFSAARAIRDQHGRDESYHPASAPDAVIFPQTTEEVAEIMVYCHAEGIPVVPFGAGTSLEGHVIALKGGICLDMSRMNRIIAVNQGDLDCTVEAGVTRMQLNSHLRNTGLFFPIDPGPDATIGGMASTRASGTNAVRYGTMREAVLSLKVVMADGRIIRTARRARKSSAGYDLTRVFVGAEGTLGIITEVTLRLHGIPETISAAVCTFPNVGKAVETASSVMQFGIPIARMEVLDTAQMRAVNRYSKTAYTEADTLFFEFHGTPNGVKEQIDLVRQITDEHGGAEFKWADTPEERIHLWHARHNAFYATVALRPDARGWTSDVCVPISQLPECITLTQQLLVGSSIPATIVGHVGDGNFHVIFAINPSSAVEVAEVAALNERIVELALRFDGTCTGEHGVGIGKKKYLHAEHGEAVAVMAAIKAALDPTGILNPQKILPN
jgi:D-lactate dehydrogenase (cytochrome)